MWFKSTVLAVASDHMEHSSSAFRQLRRRWIGIAILVGLPIISYGQPRVDIRPSPIPGIELIGPSHPEFKDIVAGLLPGRNSHADLEPILPYSILVRNSGTRTVVSYIVCFEFTRADGTRGPNRNQVRDYRTSEPKLKGSISHLITPIGGLTQAIAAGGSGSLSENRGYAEEIAQFAKVTVFLDAAAYDDGEFVGPDLYGHFEVLGVTAEYARIAKQLMSMRGAPDSAVMEWLNRQESEVSGKAAAGAGPASVGRAMAIQQEVFQIRGLEESLRTGGIGQFGMLVTAMARAGDVPLLWRRKQGENR